jgi:hypothetical protein
VNARAITYAIALIAAAPAFSPMPAVAAAAGLTAVTTPGKGDLTMCRNWLVYNSCDTYHHVAVPVHIAVGDEIPLVFGNNDKEYDFRVTGIHRQGDACTILSPHSGAHDRGEHIAVDPCKPASNSTAAR